MKSRALLLNIILSCVSRVSSEVVRRVPPSWLFHNQALLFQCFLHRFSEEVDQVLVFPELLGKFQRCVSVYIGQKGVGSILQQKLADFYPLVIGPKGYLV